MTKFELYFRECKSITIHKKERETRQWLLSVPVQHPVKAFIHSFVDQWAVCDGRHIEMKNLMQVITSQPQVVTSQSHVSYMLIY